MKTSDEKKEEIRRCSRTTTSGSPLEFVIFMFNDVEEHVVKDEDGYIVFDKVDGEIITLRILKIFFCNNDLPNEIQQIVIRNTFTRLQLLYNCLLSEEVRIRSGSILLAFENDVDRWKEMQNEDPIFKDDLPYDDNDDDDETDKVMMRTLLLVLRIL
ncbi:Inositol polyphosphate multikinase [Cyberlindnera fabianii]|uniref:Inositol polyphosphate multikinase n=1 Tax=Cyberlindnera fabianii TaxID=36022 RepID=A0A1V2L8K4_CYBFA|nr:Inositol polyphosphate multikinase [Cyberlindnera fabianii]